MMGNELLKEEKIASSDSGDGNNSPSDNCIYQSEIRRDGNFIQSIRRYFMH